MWLPRFVVSAILPLSGLGACKVYDPLYCETDRDCTDPERPFCDVNADYPASEGIRKTCIPTPADAGTGSAGDGGLADAHLSTDAAPACKWSPLTPLANVNDPEESEYVGSLSDDGLTLDFSRSGTSTNDGFFTAVRANEDQAFGIPLPIEGFNGDGVRRTDPEISGSRLEIFYLRDGFIETATRTSPTSLFGAPTPTGFEGGSPTLSSDGLALYFTDAEGVQVVRRVAVGGPWTLPETVLVPDRYYSVDVSPDELRLLVVTSPFDPGPTPISIAERRSIDEQFGPPVPVNDDILVSGGTFYSFAKWDGSQRQMIVSLVPPEGTDVVMYSSACE